MPKRRASKVVPDGSDEAWSVLGDRTRRTILECLAEQPLAVVDTAERLPVSRPACRST